MLSICRRFWYTVTYRVLFEVWSDCAEAKVSLSLRWSTCSLIGNHRENIHIYLIPLNPTFIYMGIYCFSFLLKNIDCWISLEPPRQGGSNGYPQFVFLSRNIKISEFMSENFQCFVVKLSIYLNRRVFVMCCCPAHILISASLFVCVEFNGQVNPMGSCRARSVNLTTRVLGRLSSLSG